MALVVTIAGWRMISRDFGHQKSAGTCDSLIPSGITISVGLHKERVRGSGELIKVSFRKDTTRDTSDLVVIGKARGTRI